MRENLRRIRGKLGWRQADLAEEMHQRAGWTASTVAWVENGRRDISATELVWLCHVLEVGATELMQGAGHIAMEGTNHAVPLAMLRRNVAGSGFAKRNPRRLTADDAAARDDERKAASRLGVTPDILRVAVFATYGRHLDQERNRRIGDVTGMSPRTVQAKRGHATRAIVAELAALIDEHGLEAVMNRRTR